MRILFITRKWPPAIGGMETYSAELTNALSRLDGAEIDIVSLPGRVGGHTPSPVALAFFFFVTALRLPFKSRTYDIVHFGDFVLAPLALLVFGKAKAIISVHGLDLLYGNRPGAGPRLYRFMMEAMGRFCRRKGIRLLANSGSVASIAERLGFEAIAIPLGAARCDIPAEFDFDPDTILFTGRLTPRKGAAWFAETVLPLLPRQFRLAVAGPHTDIDETERLRQNPRVELLGAVDRHDLNEIRRRSLCVVMPNRPARNNDDIEGFGLIAPEAAHAGAVLLASAEGGIVDAIRDGETGFLLPSNDAEAWRDRILEIAEWSVAERREWISKSVAAARLHYGWERVARETMAVYTDSLTAPDQ